MMSSDYSFCVQDFIETLKLVLAPGGVMLLAHQIRRAVSCHFNLRLEASSLSSDISVCFCTAMQQSCNCSSMKAISLCVLLGYSAQPEGQLSP